MNVFVSEGGMREKKKNKFLSGRMAIFNPVPQNEEEALQHGNALAAGCDSNYPVGTSECFNVGISGGCGLDCFVYQKGECTEPEEFLDNKKLTTEEIETHHDLYPLEAE